MAEKFNLQFAVPWDTAGTNGRTSDDWRASAHRCTCRQHEQTPQTACHQRDTTREPLTAAEHGWHSRCTRSLSHYTKTQ